VGASAIGTSAYRGHIDKQLKKLRSGPPEAIVEVVDSDYRDEAEEKARASSLVEYDVIY
jgi:hypothetical protein